MTIQGRVILITGGAKRIGKAIALTLAKRRARIAFSYLASTREAAKTANEIERDGTEALAVRADVSKAADVRRLIERVRQRFDRLDVLVNSAAIFERTPYSTLSETDWDRILDINLKGPFLCSLYASRLMMKRGGGKIINIADWAGLRPYGDYVPYCVSKSGVLGLTRSLAIELAPKIQVVAIAPGPMLPPASMGGRARKQIARATPLKRWGSPEDIANTVLFLIEGTDYMTGSCVFVDGGQLIA